MFFNQIKEINRLRKETNMLLNKGMSNIYVKVTIEKKCLLKTLILKVYKVRLQVSFWRAPSQEDIIEFLSLLLQLKNQRSRSKTVCGFSINFILKGIMTF